MSLKTFVIILSSDIWVQLPILRVISLIVVSQLTAQCFQRTLLESDHTTPNLLKVAYQKLGIVVKISEQETSSYLNSKLKIILCNALADVSCSWCRPILYFPLHSLAIFAIIPVCCSLLL